MVIEKYCGERARSNIDKQRRRPHTGIVPAATSAQILDRGSVMVNPFDLRTVLAKHAQHVVLIHFPIALFITAVVFDLIAQWTKRRGIAYAAYATC